MAYSVKAAMKMLMVDQAVEADQPSNTAMLPEEPEKEQDEPQPEPPEQQQEEPPAEIPVPEREDAPEPQLTETTEPPAPPESLVSNLTQAPDEPEPVAESIAPEPPPEAPETPPEPLVEPPVPEDVVQPEAFQAARVQPVQDEEPFVPPPTHRDQPLTDQQMDNMAVGQMLQQDQNDQMNDGLAIRLAESMFQREQRMIDTFDRRLAELDRRSAL